MLNINLYNEVKVSLNWQGFGSGDNCQGSTQFEGVGVSGNIITYDSTVATEITPQLDNITFSCECLNGNKQSGATQGTIMIR